MTNADTTTPVGERGIVLGHIEDGVKDEETLDLDMALSKIEALSGMMRAQEEIERLLGQELDELKSKQAGNCENAWRLLTRYSKPLTCSCTKTACALSHVAMSMTCGGVL